MNKLIPILLFAILSVSLEAQIVFEENFEGGALPDGWSIQTSATDGGWLIGSPASNSSGNFTIISNGSANVASTNDDGCNCNKSNEYLITPLIDLSGLAAAILKVDVYYTDNSYQGIDEDATIEVSTDGTNWTVLEDLHGHGSWDTHAVDLTSYIDNGGAVYIGFRYDDGGDWLYGFAIDNVIIEIPPQLEVALVDIGSRIFGEVNTALPIKGTVYNAGVNVINSMEISYTVDGGAPINEVLENLDIPPFSYYNFETATPWTPASEGIYDIQLNIANVNGTADENTDDNSGGFETEIFGEVIIPNKIEDFLNTVPVITEIDVPANSLNKPTDLDFFPILGKDELWVVNQRTENQGGSTLTIEDATAETPSNFMHRVDGNAWHFMSLPTAISFSDDNFNFATSAGVQDANHGGGTFTGPTLWSSDPEIYAQPSGGNGSHLDMLHSSPFGMGITHEVDNVFWIYDNWNEDIVRYDFVDDHGPGNDDHSDGIIRRYGNIGIDTDGDIPNHLILDKETGWLYFTDNGSDRVIRLDINTGTATSIPEINEPLAEHSVMNNFEYEVIVEGETSTRFCGIEIFEGNLLVGDYASGDITIYDMADFSELGVISTGELGLTGIKIGPDGNIWAVNRTANKLVVVTPGDFTDVTAPTNQLQVDVFPNPTKGPLVINAPGLSPDSEITLTLSNSIGESLMKVQAFGKRQQLDLSDFPNGVYFIKMQSGKFSASKKVVLSR